MGGERNNKDFVKFVVRAAVVIVVLLVPLVGANYFIDASNVIHVSDNINSNMARLALSGNIVSTPQNYNERLYQVAIVDEMSDMPETIVIGSSRGMYLGREVTGYDDIYNSCVSAACMEDYYALLGLYYQKFSKLPSRVIIETCPWAFFKDNPEGMWATIIPYSKAAGEFYRIVNGRELTGVAKVENPYLSIAYFQYNISQLRNKGMAVFDKEAHISTDSSEAADLPDGSIRYAIEFEKPGKERLKTVKSTNGPVTYDNVDKMTELDVEKTEEYENLLDFLLENDVEIIIYMQPFSVTQCHYIYDEDTNPVFNDVEAYISNLGERKGIQVVGSFDARKYDISDADFIDFMHLDKRGTGIVWAAGTTGGHE